MYKMEAEMFTIASTCRIAVNYKTRELAEKAASEYSKAGYECKITKSVTPPTLPAWAQHWPFKKASPELIRTAEKYETQQKLATTPPAPW